MEDQLLSDWIFSFRIRWGTFNGILGDNVWFVPREFQTPLFLPDLLIWFKIWLALNLVL